ncbi:MAG TPA: AAA domain-containing protein [Gemmatimonadaceae bacterium]|nr:AAA domain-containing protein [Gemmatimonadaceae bacterium]
MTTQGRPGNNDAAAIVGHASDIWIRRLIDDTRANSLLFYRDLQVGTLDLTADPLVLANLLRGDKLSVEQIVNPLIVRDPADPPDTIAQQRKVILEKRASATKALTAIRRKAKANMEEKGIDTLFLAVGMATWPAADGGRPYAAPVVLVPATIEVMGKDESNLRVRVNGEPKLNPVLVYILEKNFRVVIDADSVIKESAQEDDYGVWRVDTNRVIGNILRSMGGESDFTVNEKVVLGNFSFAKMAIVEDIRRNKVALAASELVRGIAGETQSRQNLGKSVFDVSPSELDERPASNEFLVLDADSSQQRAIIRAAAGQNAVIQGPPGTGKSQTIANLIAQTVAEGKRVLFVAEKRAALEAVMKRLSTSDVGLGHITLDLHGASVSRKEVMARIAETLQQIRTTPPVQGNEQIQQEFEAKRSALNAHAKSINEPRLPTHMSLIGMLGALLRLPKEAVTKVRLRGPILERLDLEHAALARRWLREGAAHASLMLGIDPSPWTDAEIRDGTTAQRALDEANHIADDLWPKFESSLNKLTGDLDVALPGSVDDAKELLTLLDDVRSILLSYESKVFDVARNAAAALEPARKGRLHAFWAFLTRADYRDARKLMRGLRKTPASSVVLLQDADKAVEASRRWSGRTLSGNPPRDSIFAAELQASFATLSKSLDPLDALLVMPATTARPIALARERLRRLADDRRTPLLMPTIHRLRDSISEAGLSVLLNDFRASSLPGSVWVERFEYIWLYSTVESVEALDPDLAAFKGKTHQQLVDEFVDIDQKRLRLSADRVRRLHAQSATLAMNEHFDQANLIRAEAAKKSRHIALRDLLRRAPDVLTRVAPCWIASPLSVSQLLEGGKKHFDLVIFDEASQILPEEAIPSLYRSEQVVAAGDKHQLPPTTFFSTSDDDEEPDIDDEERDAKALAGEAVGGYESLLSTLEPFLPPMPLDWHYRSADERLIAFSNQYIYNGHLITFPAATDREVLRLIHVPHDPGLGSQEESSSREVQRVIQEILKHAETRPNESLGVIAMGIKHANRVQAALDRELEIRPQLAEFFALEREDRFFVKNLETVQGDERDAIILTIGYGKSPDGTLPHRFGPLTQDVGYRRLNVAVTRARRRMTVVSSFLAHDIDLNRSGKRGVQLLKAYLEYAASGGHRLTNPEIAGEVELNSFEADIRDALTASGIETRPQFGASSYRIDLVAMHPTKPGRPVLAIECDGASYHSSATARDRDRLRQAHLQRLGWRFHRIWSTDWFFCREEEIARLVEAYREAVEKADRDDAEDSRRWQAEPASEPPVASKPKVEQPTRSEPEPALPERESIEHYYDSELRRYAEWIESDGLLRTDDELLREVFEALPFKRMGPRIRERLTRIISARRRQNAPG